MAHQQKSALIHCSTCGEDYSATYKFCPFCGGYNAPPEPVQDVEEAPVEPAATPKQSAPSKRPAPKQSAPQPQKYQFDGQDVFDQSEGDNAGGKGGKRLASGGSQRPTPPPPINWPRLITFLCSLVIIAAALVIVFTVLYPHLRQVSNPNATDAPAVTATVSPSEAGTEDGLNGMSLDTVDLTLQAEQSHSLTLTFDPVDWRGTVTWTSSDETCATVNEDGVVTNVNTSGTQRRAIITATAGTQTVTCTVYCQSGAVSTPKPVITAQPEPSQSVETGTGDIANGSKGVIVNASSGLRVRSGPGTSYDVAASLSNGDPITVVSYAGDGWYEITYAGSNGTKTGYIMGEYISAN
ncbi:SH3 domain-containing protein [Pseudoflavonifractor sp. An85]|uniref:SH3 domain-containing protein n=1 Tax=Pseudoflavonifractor sp. An85 TaxID=1965661 RepID=UPI000B556052|nr:SH3 domain-containing protein [Pseudoflavonifractor sp. An85]OUN24378.1 hypothetical protein B5G37_07935 [Pseudoflavonifractor sp. An85]